ncbi:MAG: S8/S53 family peptidase [Vicingaceae bacterium]
MRNLLLVILLCFFLKGYSQHSKVNIPLKLALEKETNKDKLFPLFVVGEAEKITAEVLKLEGKIIRSSGNIVQVKLPINTIENFSKNTFVKSMPYAFSKGKILSDTMTIHNNVTPIHNGVSPLLQSYTGKGVVFGVIDTGQDIVHPDFKDTLGNTRIYRIWDQNTGVYWDSTSINNGTCTHTDYGINHGTQVAGIGAGNGLALNKYAGVAGEATIVAVANNLNASNWLYSIVDAVDYIYNVADSLGMPCVINASVGDYFGSHDGTDPAAILIDSIVNYQPGRAFVCAGGNAGYFNWHVGQNVTSDTAFTWLKYNPSSSLGVGSVFYEIWADTANFNNVDYAFGANLPSGSFEERGRTNFFNINDRLGNYTDTIWNGNNILAIVQTYAEIQNDKYMLQVFLNEPDSNAYNFSFLSTGSGKFDFWSTTALGTSDIVETNLPNASIYPPIVNYTLPDSALTIVSSFSCSPNLITVANFVNRRVYYDIDSNEVVGDKLAGEKAFSSSLGPDRKGRVKPDIGATGDFTLGAVSTTTVNGLINTGQNYKVGIGGMHIRNGGTSMASPVVAGTVALYLEKCPNASMVEIKSALLGTAKQDNFTGALPNFAFGYGKVDAFEALNLSTNPITLSNDSIICGNDSLVLTAPSSISYLWSGGEMSQSITVDSTTSVYVTTTNGSGCKTVSDTLSVTWHPQPIKPTITIVNDDSLLLQSLSNIQWYYDMNLLVGETDTLHIAQNNGLYFAELTNSFGCKNQSDTVNITVIGIAEYEQSLFSVFPNPSNGIIKVLWEQEGIKTINLINALGKVVSNKSVLKNTNKTTLNLTEFANGIYHLQLISNKSKYQKKIVLLR